MRNSAIKALSLIFALLLTVLQSYPGRCQSVIQRGANVESGASALMTTVPTKEPAQDVSMLLNTGAAVNGANVSGEIALFKTNRAGNDSPLALLKSGASPTVAIGTGESGMIAGADNRRVGTVWALLVPETEPGAWGRIAVTSFTKAGEHGNPARVQAPMAGGADESACDWNEEAARMKDAITGYQEAVAVRPVTGAENSVPPPYG